jgi:hypothetical protein
MPSYTFVIRRLFVLPAPILSKTHLSVYVPLPLRNGPFSFLFYSVSVDLFRCSSFLLSVLDNSDFHGFHHLESM